MSAALDRLTTPSAPYRRRRVLWGVAIVSLGLLAYLGAYGAPLHDLVTSKENPFAPARKTSGLSAPADHQTTTAMPTRAQTTAPAVQVREIDALLHFVSSHPNRRLDAAVGERAPDLRVYSPGSGGAWDARLRALHTEHPLVVFSKSYCPYSKRAKWLLEQYDVTPRPLVVELDQRDDGSTIQDVLLRLTGRRTVPNVLVKGESLGGADDIGRMHQSGSLKEALQNAGLTVRGPHETGKE